MTSTLTISYSRVLSHYAHVHQEFTRDHHSSKSPTSYRFRIFVFVVAVLSRSESSLSESISHHLFYKKAPKHTSKICNIQTGELKLSFFPSFLGLLPIESIKRLLHQIDPQPLFSHSWRVNNRGHQIPPVILSNR